MAIEPRYCNSWAVVVGINEYETTNPLLHARADAQAVSQTLVEDFGFPNENVVVLLDADASKDAVMEAFLDLNRRTAENDRVLFFFAGHGVTITSYRGEVGFLVPHNGDPAELHTLVRWDELTRSADLIPAKHILFVMDACYGGLAIQRSLAAGSTRYLKDMLMRPVRQVLTAGKADEPVSDAGGPIPGHSVFTGYLLQGLRGEAATAEGVISANSLMPYVHYGVSRNDATQQTPHYGFLQGDGDFVFSYPAIEEEGSGETGSDLAIEVPTSSEPLIAGAEDVVSMAKTYLSAPGGAIPLHDLVVTQTRDALNRIAQANLPIAGTQLSADEFQRRLSLYEDLTGDLQSLAALLGHWGHGDTANLLVTALSRMVDFSETPQGGSVVWIELQWYPAMLLLYTAGVSAVAAGNAEALTAVLQTEAGGFYRGMPSQFLVLALGNASARLHDAFKLLPDHTRNYVPRSEYLHARLQPLLDDLFFLGASYSRVFDQFEGMLSMVHVDLDEGHDWSPLGRFAYQYAQRDRYSRQDPFTALESEFEGEGDQWAFLQHGLFGGSPDRLRAAFAAVAGHTPASWAH